MAGISSKVLKGNYVGSNRGFNGNELQTKEFNDQSGIDNYDFNARTYDQQIGKFLQIDPLADEGNQESLSTFQFGNNNPVRFNDPDGKCPICVIVIVAGLLMVSEPAVAPTGQKSDGPKIENAHRNAALQTVGALAPSIIKPFVNLAKRDASEATGKNKSEETPNNKQPENFKNEKANNNRNSPDTKGEANTSKIEQKDENGVTTQYSTFDKNGLIQKQYRGVGKDHGPIPRPNVKEPIINKNPKTGEEFLNGWSIRPARKDEIPVGPRPRN